jgi:lysophospholipase L1-like esterase
MSARGRFLSVLVSIVIALAGFVTVGALPAAAAPGAVQYVALGDSYAAGTAAGIFPVCPHGDGGYPESLLDLGSRIDLRDNVACSGATTFAVVDNQLNQLSALNGDTRLVTLTVGAANLGLSSILAVCSDPNRLIECLMKIAEAGEPGDLSVLGSNLVSLFAGVAKVAPRARIVVTGYPHLFAPTADVHPSIIIAVNQATDALNSTIEQAVSVANDADANIHYVDVTEEFAGHGIGSSDPFINELPDPNAFHPNELGYDAYADAISAALPGGWLDKQKQSA